jgi:hypothetical protein
MNEITEVSRRDIIDYILSREKTFSGRLDTTEFLELVWKECGIFGIYSELKHAKQDLWQHTINNYDWDDRYLLYQYFRLLECEDIQFLCFLEKCVHPVVVSEVSEIEEFTKEMNNILKYDGYTLESRKKISGKPVYSATKCPKYEYDWDVFICHTSEDKERFVEALASKLRGVQISVWYDDFSLRLGDRLKDKIEEGLARSRFGIIVLSKHFFAKKKWPQDELNVLVQRDSFNRTVILPIWLDVNYDDVFEHSPLLAGHVAVRAEEGLDRVVEKILMEIRLP